MTRTARRIGLLGGSFNPAHGGHRRISLFTQKALGLDEVWWLVSPGNPLKSDADMARFSARFRSAQARARRAPIVPTAIESALGTRYTVDTLSRLSQRYRNRQFVWLMGSDNLAQFHLWKGWRQIARAMPIAVIARPGYTSAAMTSPAMAWLRRYSASAAGIRKRGQWSAPALVFLRFDPDDRSATAFRRAHADWASQWTHGHSSTHADLGPRDRLTFRRIPGWDNA